MIFLREITKEDMSIINNWRRSKDLVQSLGAPFRFINIETDEAWFSQYMSSRAQNVRCAICLSKTKEIVGVIYLLNIDSVMRGCDFGIMIGDVSHRGKGIGSMAMDMIIDHAFLDLNLNRIQLRVQPSNAHAIALYKKYGFKEEGVLREVIFKNGQYEDLLMMSLLRKDFSEMKRIAPSD